jgi:hypothetical protein
MNLREKIANVPWQEVKSKEFEKGSILYRNIEGSDYINYMSFHGVLDWHISHSFTKDGNKIQTITIKQRNSHGEEFTADIVLFFTDK